MPDVDLIARRRACAADPDGRPWVGRERVVRGGLGLDDEDGR